jgi:hypothetical protein
MQVAFLLSVSELKAARKAFSKRIHSRVRRARPWLNIAAPFLMALVFLISGFHFFRRPRRTPDIFDLTMLVIWLVLGAYEWTRRNQVGFEPDYAKEQTFELEEDGFIRGTAGSAKVKVPWTKISRYVETEEFFLLSSPWPWGMEKPEKPSVLGKQNRPVLYILPKRAFDSGDVERFRGLLQRKLSVWAKNPCLKPDTILTS